jgi:AbrB family looped-hinge helix DNA binding protein
MPTATVTSKGQITIPRDVRRELKLVAGSKVEFIPDGNGWYRIVSKAKSLSEVIGCIPYSGPAVLVEDMCEGISDAVADEYERGL